MNKITYVKWIDSMGSSEAEVWSDKNKVIKEAKVAECETAGFNLKETNQFICLALSTGDEQVAAWMIIPKKVIKERKDFELPC